jgi:hypothetical protein
VSGGRGRAAADALLAELETGFGRVSTNVYKSTVNYVWDGERAVARQLGFTPFGGGPLAPIVTTGKLETHEGRFSSHEVVAFGGAGESRMLLLPGGCYALAPAELSPGLSSFITEFGAVLEPAESFGLMGFVDDDTNADSASSGEEDRGDGDAGGAAAPLSLEQAASNPSTLRMVRVMRLYASGRRFVSATTSLCTAVGDGASGSGSRS